MTRFTVHTVDSAPEAAKARVQAAFNANGFIPNLIGVLANAPAALAFYQEVGKLNAQTSLSDGEREVIQLIAAKTNQCNFCVAGHTKLATVKELLSSEDIQAARSANVKAFSNEKLSALAQFTIDIMTQRGNVDQAQLQAFLNAGYTQQQAIEVVMGVALATLCNYTNNLAKTEINPELQAFA